jgi:hypothetical protein
MVSDQPPEPPSLESCQPSTSSTFTSRSKPTTPSKPPPKASSKTMAEEILEEIRSEVSSAPLPPDNVHLRSCVGSASEDTARLLYARLAYYALDVVILPASNFPGNCLFDSILYSVPHPDLYTAYHLRLQVVMFLVNSAAEMFPHLESTLLIKGISYYTMCKRLLLPGEWGGLETLLFLKHSWNLAVVVISPGHDLQVNHRCCVQKSPLVLAYNGSSHYMPIGNFSVLLLSMVVSVLTS